MSPASRPLPGRLGRRSRWRLAAAAGSTAVGLALAWLIVEGRGLRPLLELLDNTEDVVRLLERRAREGPIEHPADSGFPPPLRREPIDPETARILFGMLSIEDGVQYDPDCYYRRAGNLERTCPFPEHPEGSWVSRTNSLGMREDLEVMAERPDLRILVTGDSHTEGVCNNAESFANVLEGMLAAARPGERVEVLNAGTGGYMLYNYLGVYEAHRALDPDVFVVVIYGGNDFSQSLTPWRYFHRRPPPSFEPLGYEEIVAAREAAPGVVAQELVQVAHFVNNPADEALAVEVSASVLMEIARLCEEDQTQLVCAYLPPASVQLRFFEAAVRTGVVALGLEGAALKIGDRLADGLLDILRGEGIRVVDLRPPLRASETRCYWATDMHLNVEGHRLAAAALFDALSPR